MRRQCRKLRRLFRMNYFTHANIILKLDHKVEMGVRWHSVTQFQSQILCLPVCRGVCEHASPCGYAPLSPTRYHVTILRAHSTAVSVTASFAGWSCCGCARRSPTLECILKALCLRVGKNTHTDDVVQSFINSLVQTNMFCCHWKSNWSAVKVGIMPHLTNLSLFIWRTWRSSLKPLGNVSLSMVSGTNHSSLDRHFFQNDDKNDKTHRAQNVYLSSRLDAAQNVRLSRRET